MRVGKYEITITEAIEETNNSEQLYDIGDIVKINTDRSQWNGKFGIITEVRDKRECNLLIPSGRGWYYFVEVEGGGGEEKQEHLELVIRKDALLRKIKEVGRNRKK